MRRPAGRDLAGASWRPRAVGRTHRVDPVCRRAVFVWVLLASFKTRAELYATPIVLSTGVPERHELRGGLDLQVAPFSRFFANSLWVSSVTMVATTVVSILAGYALARFRFAAGRRSS